MENKQFWLSLNKRAELPKAQAKRRKVPLNRSLELSLEGKYHAEQGKKDKQVEMRKLRLQHSCTMMEIGDGELGGEAKYDFLNRRVSQQINSVKAEINIKIAAYIKNARLSYLQAKGLKREHTAAHL
jgi:hypothetical protein